MELELYVCLDELVEVFVIAECDLNGDGVLPLLDKFIDIIKQKLYVITDGHGTLY